MSKICGAEGCKKLGDFILIALNGEKLYFCREHFIQFGNVLRKIAEAYVSLKLEMLREKMLIDLNA